MKGFFRSGAVIYMAQAGEFVPIKLIVFYSIYGLHMCLIMCLEDLS